MAKTANRKAKKRPGWIPANAFGPNNPPPKSPGRPKKPLPPEPVLEEGIPAQLAAMRAAAHWQYDTLPQLAVVRFLVNLKKKNPLGFNSQWQAQERAFLKLGGGFPAPDEPDLPEAADTPEAVACGVTPKVVETMEEWLSRHLARANS